MIHRCMEKVDFLNKIVLYKHKKTTYPFIYLICSTQHISETKMVQNNKQIGKKEFKKEKVLLGSRLIFSFSFQQTLEEEPHKLLHNVQLQFVRMEGTV